MRLSRGARHALLAAMEMARALPDPVTAAEVARRHAVPPTAMAKVFQRLVRAGIAVGLRGVGGGYRLAAKPSEVTVLAVIAPFEGVPPPEPAAPPPGDPLVEERLRALMDEVVGTVRSTLASVSLAALIREEQPLGGRP